MTVVTYCIRCKVITPSEIFQGPYGNRVYCSRCGWIKIPAISDETARLSA